MATPEVIEQAQGIAALGINAKALIFQIVNFTILLVILRLVAYKPILAMLEKRRKIIEDSLEKAKQIEETRAKLEEKSQIILAKAKLDAQKIVNEAKQIGESLKSDLVKEAKRHQEIIAEQTKSQIESEKERMIEDAKKQLGYLVVAAASKVIEKNIDQKKNEKLVASAIGELE